MKQRHYVQVRKVIRELCSKACGVASQCKPVAGGTAPLEAHESGTSEYNKSLNRLHRDMESVHQGHMNFEVVCSGVASAAPETDGEGLLVMEDP
jgi:hypothetical protein